MAKARIHQKSIGFSLVEMLVALFFTLVLMAGMATVFKTSLTTFYTSGETLSSVRRNRMSIDLLSDDMNNAGMYLYDISSPPAVGSSNPPFYILPNQAVANAGTDDPATADQLFFYMDEPLPFEGTLSLVGPTSGRSNDYLVLNQSAQVDADRIFSVDCKTAEFAAMVKQGQVVIFKDSFESAYIGGTPTVSGTTVTFTTTADANLALTGKGSSGYTQTPHIQNSGVVFILPAQMVRYSVAILKLDPQIENGIPCLVRDQGTYSSGGFVADGTQQIITENVSGFKVYLSADSGSTWAGYGQSYATFAAGWDQGIRKALDDQLALYPRTFHQPAGP